MPAVSRPHLSPAGSPSFALISVLALVSLSALTATAFLASARLQRRANTSLVTSTQLDMAMNAAANAAAEMLDNGHGDRVTFLTTYWRGTGPDDWTNELGYLLNGFATNSGTNTGMRFVACFSTATFTNLETAASSMITVSNGVSSQAMFRSNMETFMVAMTNFANGEFTNIPLLGDLPNNRYTSPPVGWVYVKQDVRVEPGSINTTNAPVARFAFYVQDLGGLLDAQRNGASTTRSTGTNPEEISIANAAGASPNLLASAGSLSDPVKRRLFLSPGTLTRPELGNLTTEDLRYVTTALPSWNSAWETIPSGLGYQDGTNPKYNINSNNFTVQSLEKIISGNLTNFSARSGAMPGGAYVSNIAANIIDYIDTDSKPTVDNSASPNYLGIENIPWPNELFDRIVFSNVTTAGWLQLELKDWVEVWNMGNTNIPKGTKLTMNNNYDLMLSFTNPVANRGFKTNLNLTQVLSFTNEANPNPPLLGPFTMRGFNLPEDLPPNGYVVLPSSDNSATLRLGIKLTNAGDYATATIRNGWRLRIEETDQTKNMSYKAYDDSGVLIQQSQGGRWPRFCASTIFQANNGSPTKFIFCNPIGYASQVGPSGAASVPAHSGGDPRAQLFLSGPLRLHNYTNYYPSPGGRNCEIYNLTNIPASPARTPFPESEVNPGKYWPDGGHVTNDDLIGLTNPANGNRDNCPSSYDVKPDEYNPSTNLPLNVRQNLTNYFVMIRNDSGKMTNIVELGNIYDPMQWGDQAGSGVANQPGLWTNLTLSATNDSRFGGRNTLRIGRWEFTRFAFTNVPDSPLPIPNMMMSAAALLDIFCLTNSDGRYDEGGRINLNTAPAPVLRALAGGIFLDKDPLISNPQVPESMTAAFAQGVMRFRATYPFYSPSQLAFISTDYGSNYNANPVGYWTNRWPTNSVFGNNSTNIPINRFPGNLLTNASIGFTNWNDQAAEEWFAKIYRLATTQSRNYRCYVLAQLVETNGKPKGPVVRKYFNIIARNNALNPGESISASTYIQSEAPY